MAFELVAIRKAIASAAATVPGINTSKHYTPDAEHGSPAFWVGSPASMTSAPLQRARWSVELPCTLHVAAAWDRSAQEKADDLAAALWTAIETDRTLDGTVSDVAVMSAEWVTDDAGLRVLFTVHVEAP